MSTSKGLAILLVVILVISAYIALAWWLAVKDNWVGFLFLTQWTVVDGGKMAQLPRTMLGALVGMLIALSAILLTPWIGSGPALAALLLFVLVATFLFIVGRAPYVVNAATMMFLAVLSVPAIQASTTPASLFIGLALGVTYYGGLGLIGSTLVGSRKGAPQAA